VRGRLHGGGDIDPERRFPSLAAAVGGLLVVLVAIGVADGRERLYDEVPNQLPRVLLAWATLLGVPLWVGWAARVGREQAATGPTRSGCGWPGSCTTWSRTRSP
jgi:hypothetical protein